MTLRMGHPYNWAMASYSCLYRLHPVIVQVQAQVVPACVPAAVAVVLLVVADLGARLCSAEVVAAAVAQLADAARAAWVAAAVENGLVDRSLGPSAVIVAEPEPVLCASVGCAEPAVAVAALLSAPVAVLVL